MITFTEVLTLLGLHWVFDFVLQSHKMACNKSKDVRWLTYHCAVYSIGFIIISPAFALLNGLIHFVVDFCTSRITSKLYKDEEYHNFFVIIGLDQLIHMVVLFGTYMFWFN